MPEEYFLRMVQLADEFFHVKNDPEQLSIDEEVLKHLHRIHPNTVGEERVEKGPVAWMIVIPTTTEVMNRFLSGELNEHELLEHTPVGASYEAVYLCSALVLPEFRRKGIAKKLALQSIRAIQQTHTIQHLFYWGFSTEGKTLAEEIAKELGLPLYNRTTA